MLSMKSLGWGVVDSGFFVKKSFYNFTMTRLWAPRLNVYNRSGGVAERDSIAIYKCVRVRTLSDRS